MTDAQFYARCLLDVVVLGVGLAIIYRVLAREVREWGMAAVGRKTKPKPAAMRPAPPLDRDLANLDESPEAATEPVDDMEWANHPVYSRGSLTGRTETRG